MSKKKDNGLMDALADIMGTVTQETTNDHETIQTTTVAHKRPQRNLVVNVRFTLDEIEAIDAIAAQEGATRSTIIRRAAKDLIRRGR
jgi:predicted DNA binding CopG/RHH family protein